MRSTWILGWVAVLVLLAVGCGSEWSLPGKFGKVKGQVVDEGSGLGIKGVTVQCGGDIGFTDSSGLFELDEVAVGEQLLKVWKDGYVGIAHDQKSVKVIEDTTTEAGKLKLAKVTNGAVLLDNLTPTGKDDMEIGARIFNGVTYEHTVHGSSYLNDNDAKMDFYINGKFNRFKATVGVDDLTPYTSLYYKFLVYVDGDKKAELQLSEAHALPIDLDVVNAKTLRLEIHCPDSVEGRKGGLYAGFGDARLVL